MSDKSPQKSKDKKKASRTLMEKRIDKKAKKAGGNGPTIPPTGH
jgi:hypothetical protein